MSKLRKLLWDLGVIAGALLFLFGLYQIWHPLAPIIGGLIIAGACFLGGYDRQRRDMVEQLRRGARS